jgi:hypothetical protein
MNPMSAFQAELVAGLHDARIASGREAESGRGAARALDQIVNRLGQNGANGPISDDAQQTTFALALRQVNDQGQRVNRKLNKPDISFIADDNGTQRRVNVEIETQNVTQHATMVNRDPNAVNLFVKVHPWTGAVESGWMREPGGKMVRVSKAEIDHAIDQRLKALPDGSLKVSKKGTQVRAPSKAAPAASKATTAAARPKPARAATATPTRRSGRPAREFEAELEHEFAMESASEAVAV